MKLVYYTLIFTALIFTKAYAYTVSASILPLQSLVAMVSEDITDTNLIINPKLSPHDLELTYKQSALIRNSDLVIIISRDFEKVIYNAVTDSNKLIEMIQAPDMQIQPYNNFLLSSHATTKHLATTTNFHLWLDSNNAIAFLKYLAKELANRDPKNANTYLTNATKYIQIINHFKASNYQINHKNNFITYHNGYSYLINSLKLNQQHQGSIAKEAHDSSPISIKSLLNLKHFIKNNNVSCVLMEANLPDKNIQKFIKDNKLHTNTLNAIGQRVDNEKIQTIYLKIIQYNIKMIQDCLS